MKDIFNTLSRATVILLGTFLLLLVGMIDYLTGPGFSLSVFYLIPVLLVSWYAGKSSGIFISFAGAFVWLVAGLLGKKYHEHPVELYWDDIMELVFFLVVTTLISELKNSLQREQLSAKTDYLTGVPNWRHFYEFAEEELSRSLRYHHPLTVVYFDIDNFKVVNDTMGHNAGDVLLRLVAATVSKNIRTSDMIARLGGDEFAMLLPESGPEAAENAINKAMDALKEALKDHWPVSFSVGIVTYMTPPATVDELLKKADHLMYSVKMAGKGAIRHQVVD
jgi:diguanylate cyclase (GGDEF)-like protein